MRRALVVAKEPAGAGRLAALAARLSEPGGRVEVLHVLDAGGREAAAAAGAMVDEAVETLRGAGLEAAGVVTAWELPTIGAEIAREAARLRPDLILIGSRGLGRVEALVRGSVSRAVLAGTDCAMLIVPSGATPGSGRIRRVLAAVQSEEDAYALAELLPGVGAGLEVAIVHAPRLVGVHPGAGGSSYVEIPETSSAVLSAAVEALGRRGLRPVVRGLERGRGVASAISLAAAVWEAELVAVGSRRMADWEELLFGSVSQELVRHGERPVLIAQRPPRTG